MCVDLSPCLWFDSMINLFVLMPTISVYYYYSSLVRPPEVLLFYSIVWALLGFVSYMKLSIILSWSVKLYWNFDGNGIKSVDCFYKTVSMGNLSIFWYLLQFLYSKTWSVYHTNLSLPWLELPQDNLYYFWLL